MRPGVFLTVPPLTHRREIIHLCHRRTQSSEQGLCLLFLFDSQTRLVLYQQRGEILYMKQGGQGVEKPLLTIAQSNFFLKPMPVVMHCLDL